MELKICKSLYLLLKNPVSFTMSKVFLRHFNPAIQPVILRAQKIGSKKGKKEASQELLNERESLLWVLINWTRDDRYDTLA